MSNMQLVPRGPSWREVVAVKIADALLVAGRGLQRRYVVLPEDASTWEWRDEWRQALAGFVTWSAPLEFSRARTLAAGVCTRPTYEHMMRLLRKMGVVHTWHRSGTIWVSGWDKRKFLSALRRGEIEAPYPIGVEAPRILNTRVREAQPTHPAQQSQLGGVVFAKDAPAREPRLKGDRKG